MTIPLLCPYQHLISSYIVHVYQTWLSQDLGIIDWPKQTHIHICKHFISIYNCLGYNDVSTYLEIIIIPCKSLYWPCNSNVDPINEYLNTKLSTPPFIIIYNFAPTEQWNKNVYTTWTTWQPLKAPRNDKFTNGKQLTINQKVGTLFNLVNCTSYSYSNRNSFTIFCVLLNNQWLHFLKQLKIK